MGFFERVFQPKVESKIEQEKQDQKDETLNPFETLGPKEQEKIIKIDQVKQCLEGYQKWLDPDYIDSLHNARPLNITQKEIDARYLGRLKSGGVDEEQIRRAEEAVAIQRAIENRYKKREPEILLQHFTRIQQELNQKEAKAKQELQNFPNSEIEEYTRLKREIEELKARVIAREIELEHLRNSLPLIPKSKIDLQNAHRTKDLVGGISARRSEITIKEEELRQTPYFLQLERSENLKKLKEEFGNINL